MACNQPHGIRSDRSDLCGRPLGSGARDPGFRADIFVFFDSILDRFEVANVEMPTLRAIIFHRSETNPSAALVVLAPEMPFLWTFEVCLTSLGGLTEQSAMTSNPQFQT
jgi:hypothetical protein